MRGVVISVAALTCCAWTAQLSASEVVRLPVSCSYVDNEIVLAPSPREEAHAIVGDREHRTVRACTPGPPSKCMSWEVHRFDLMCGGRQVSWRQVASQLLNLTSGAAKRDVAFRTRLEPWEVRVLFAESGFAPVNEFGARIASRPMLQPLASRDAATAKLGVATEMVAAPASHEVGADAVASRIEPAKVADTPPFVHPVAALQQSSGEAMAQPPVTSANGEPQSTPSFMADKGDVTLANTVTPQPEAAKREMGAAADAVTSDARSDDKSVPHLPGRFVDFTVILPAALLLITVFLATFVALMWRRWASSRPPRRGTIRVTYENEPAPQDANTLAETCRELMTQVTTELVKAMSAINGLKGAPALQTALYTELDSIRRSVGFTAQSRGTAGEKKDWREIKLQLTLGLEGTQRIIGIAEAARTSFSAHPAAMEVITTRLEAYAFLGVNASCSETALKKAVNALRQCWHPDLATDEEDRLLREIRIKQINVAWDLISRKQMSAC